ncbi:hypothetical protein [Corynebacterium coyleae]|uniref:hypothetical protein n=1 Tax=Corynebacterium coyleae TaxID=53374 RepID=UPI00254BB6CD|nr:hypothetical protein [Corynebacterium coyleae]MDK8799547.1 hypothetical protein [Corynebacterium coyleae]
MQNTTNADTWAISNNVTVTLNEGGPAVVVTADTAFNPAQTGRLVRDLLDAQRFIMDTFEPIPFIPA